MRRPLVISAIALFGSTSADAATKLCLRKLPWTVPAPVNPSLVLESDRVDQFVVTTPDGTPVRFAATPLDHYWSRVTIDAPAGTEVVVPALASTCNGSPRVTLATAGRVRDDRAPTNVTAYDYGDGLLVLEHDEAPALARMRVDWAYTRTDLDAGLHGTRIEVPRAAQPVSSIDVPVTADFDVVFIRLTPLLLDGSSGQSWVGWVHRDRETETLRVGEGESPLPAARPRLDCEPRAPWVVGEQPTLAYERDHRTFRAITHDGRALATTVSSARGFSGLGSTTNVTVGARDGDAFRLEVLPVGTSCPLDVRVVRGAAAPRAVVQSPEVEVVLGWGPLLGRPYEHRLRVAVGERQVASASGNISWHGEQRLHIAAGTIVVPADDEAGDWTYEASPLSGHDVMRVVIAPVRDGFRGRPCQVWMIRDTASGDITLRGDLEQVPDGLDSCLDPVDVRPPVVSAPRQAPASATAGCCMPSRQFLFAIGAVLCLALACLLGRRAEPDA